MCLMFMTETSSDWSPTAVTSFMVVSLSSVSSDLIRLFNPQEYIFKISANVTFLTKLKWKPIQTIKALQQVWI